jgi:hypothetical protein
MINSSVTPRFGIPYLQLILLHLSLRLLYGLAEVNPRQSPVKILFEVISGTSH